MIQELSKELDFIPRDIEDLKSVLSIISHVKAISMDTEFNVKEIEESYRILCIYGIEVSWADNNVDKR